jgi:hypothetical protein
MGKSSNRKNDWNTAGTGKTFKQKVLYAAMSRIGHVDTRYGGSAQAVYMNDDGLGRALVYPYYTMRNGNTTLLSVASLRDESKALVVRFLEGKNSREVLDFNLFLSAKDPWPGVIFLDTGTSNEKVLPDGSIEINGSDGLLYTIPSPFTT